MYDIEDIKKRVENGEPYEAIGREYNVSGNYIKKILIKNNIPLERRRKISENETFNKGIHNLSVCKNCNKKFISKYKGHKFCSLKCSSEFHSRKKEEDVLKKWKCGEFNGVSGKYGISTIIRKYLFDKNNNKCELCGWSEINKSTGKIPLEVHHKDGDYTNNKEENLQLLCPNCHSLTSTYKSHNKKGRVGRQKYK